MSKMAVIRQLQYSPQAGGLLGTIIKGAGKLFKAIKGSKAAAVAGKVARSPVGQAAIYTGAGMAAGKLMDPGTAAQAALTGPGASGGWRPRRSRGITARELRGYRKVARLLHKEGMVSKRARGRH